MADLTLEVLDSHELAPHHTGGSWMEDPMELTFREKLEVITLDSAAAIKAWESRRRGKAEKETLRQKMVRAGELSEEQRRVEVPTPPPRNAATGQPIPRQSREQDRRDAIDRVNQAFKQEFGQPDEEDPRSGFREYPSTSSIDERRLKEDIAEAKRNGEDWVFVKPASFWETYIPLKDAELVYESLTRRDAFSRRWARRIDFSLDGDRSEAARKAWETRHARGEGAKPNDPTPARTRTERPIRTTELRPATPADKARIKALKIPPAWTDIRLSDDPTSDLQATGKDKKGDTQYRYSAEHSERQAAEKFARLKDFNRELPNIRRQILNDMKDTEEAVVLYLIDKTGFRPGGEETSGDVYAYGATTLEPKHVKVTGDEVKFSFVGKKGVKIEKTVTDQRLAKAIQRRMNRQGTLFDTDDGKVRRYMKRIAPDFKVKDFRTQIAVAAALKAVASIPKPKTDKELKNARREVGKIVGGLLGNTPAVALKSYIDPAVFSKWKAKNKP